MNSRVLGAFVFLVYTAHALYNLLGYFSLKRMTVPGNHPFEGMMERLHAFNLGFWIVAFLAYHVLAFGRPENPTWLARWLASPAGGGSFALAVLLTSVHTCGVAIIQLSSSTLGLNGTSITNLIANGLIVAISSYWLVTRIAMANTQQRLEQAAAEQL